MSWISFSAPAVDDETLRKEINSLSEQEKEKVRRDVYGLNIPIVESQKFLKRKLELLDQALSHTDQKECEIFKESLNDLEHYLSRLTRNDGLELLEESQFPYAKCDEFIEMFHRINFEKSYQNNEKEELYSTSAFGVRNSLDTLAIIAESGEKTEFERAQLLCPKYVNSDSFRLMFLRAEEFNETAAARRIVSYWEEKVIIFGRKNAFRKVTLDDFDEDDNQALHCEGLVLLPERDEAGRAIMLSLRNKWETRGDHRNSMLKYFWYIHLAALENEEVQRNGIVIIATQKRGEDISGVSDTSSFSLSAFFDRKLEKSISRITNNALPIRIVGVHHIIRKKLIVAITMPLTLFLFGPSMRARYRQHDGDNIDEYLESLQSYGISPDILPTEIGGNLEFDYRAWLQGRIESNI